MKSALLVLLFAAALYRADAQRIAPDTIPLGKGSLIIQPIQHASVVLTAAGKTIYVDPVGGAAKYQGLAAPDFILITHIHGDHFDSSTIAGIKTATTVLIVPKIVADKLPVTDNIVVLANGDQSKQSGWSVTAVPMYNLPAGSPTARHPKGLGNGYVLNIGGKNIYFSGDTEDIPEMRALKNIDVAFVCMNLPYTMDINHAADAVLAFKPRIVYPYHYRGQGGLSDVNGFKNLVNAGDKNIEVRLRNWYPG
jgi:L-ascorbate metabolism protein UlaG (beta-lactamase superfamily)